MRGTKVDRATAEEGSAVTEAGAAGPTHPAARSQGGGQPTGAAPPVPIPGSSSAAGWSELCGRETDMWKMTVAMNTRDLEATSVSVSAAASFSVVSWLWPKRNRRRRLPIERRYRAAPPIVPLPFLHPAAISGHIARLLSQALEERGIHRETAEMDPGGTVLHATAGRSDIPGSAESAPAHGACVAAGDVVVGERGEVDVGDAEVGIGVEENVVGEAEEGLGASPPVSAARAVRLHRSGPRVEKSRSIGNRVGTPKQPHANASTEQTALLLPIIYRYSIGHPSCDWRTTQTHWVPHRSLPCLGIMVSLVVKTARQTWRHAQHRFLRDLITDRSIRARSEGREVRRE
ncbi:hypothetical protein B296_00007745 [Ensete ventricosum]|uniref:Uncharacterized protein n=1 Tax=Ensete ventricosum TaxID=4639 RepID=A0A427AKU0_ENSVE|nr:hypothetical protein B296_00007745 [Ensete ventricosum]